MRKEGRKARGKEEEKESKREGQKDRADEVRRQGS